MRFPSKRNSGSSGTGANATSGHPRRRRQRGPDVPRRAGGIEALPGVVDDVLLVGHGASGFSSRRFTGPVSVPPARMATTQGLPGARPNSLSMICAQCSKAILPGP